ncbi:MAG: hypothetical protein NDJ89_10795 [Oligoflexia bacterium]|nr:hypothetical protein [Oligoflexia bacterium]
MEKLYGERLGYETRLNRFKALLATLRKKAPQLIVFEQGRYSLADPLGQLETEIA